MDFVNLELNAAIKVIYWVYLEVFPEYPQIGFFIVGLALILFLVYLIKAGLGAAFKVSVVTLLSLSFIVFAVHCIHTLLHLG